MWVKEISLENFRNFTSIKAGLTNGINIIYGENANGKTNFIEAIYLCACGRSQRAGSDSELIRFGCGEAHLQAVVQSDLNRSIDVHLFHGGKKKGIAIDHIPIKKLNQLFGTLLVVIFTPEDLKMVKAGPGERRTFMDTELCQLNSVYYYALKQYYKALRQRNNLLKSIVKNHSLEDTLEIWDSPLSEYGSQIMVHRAAFIDEIKVIAAEIHGSITGNSEQLTLVYRPNITTQYAEKLKRNVKRDIMLGSTSAGIHKDDITFMINGNDLRVYGSQGQQRTAALSVKLAEIKLIKERTNEVPVLLLDDVLSELDEKRQGFLFNHISNIQTVLTCTGIEDVLKRTTGNVMKMVKGEIN